MRKLLATTALATAALGLTATTVAAAPPSQGTTIVGKAIELSGAPGSFDGNGGDFDILIDAAVQLDLAGALSSNRQLTVFAPVDAAFQELAPGVPEEDVAAVLVEQLGADTVRSVVLYHVTPGRRAAASVLPATQLPTLNGAQLTKAPGAVIDTAADEAGAKIVVPNVTASNGIIHAIDAVLLPGS